MARALFTGNTSCKHSQNIPSLLHIPHDFLATHHPYQYPTHNGRPLYSFELFFGNNSSCVCNGTTAKLTLHLIIFPSQLIKRSQCFCCLQFLFHLFLNVVYGRVQKSLKCSTFFSLYAKSKKVHIFLGTHNSYVWAWSVLFCALNRQYQISWACNVALTTTTTQQCTTSNNVL